LKATKKNLQEGSPSDPATSAYPQRTGFPQFHADIFGPQIIPAATFFSLEASLPATYNDYQLKYKIDINKNNQLSFISIGALDHSS